MQKPKMDLLCRVTMQKLENGSSQQQCRNPQKMILLVAIQKPEEK
jgi:hypothetical protein